MVKIHFGTDGIRGRANENLTITMAYRIGQTFLCRKKSQDPDRQRHQIVRNHV